MTSLMLETEPVAINVTVSDEKLIVDLEDGRSVSIPLVWYPRLADASDDERRNWELLGDGYAIEWPALDEHIGVEALLAGKRSGESSKSLERWRAARSA